MEISAWHLWIILGIVLCIAEIFTPAFVLASFGVACLLPAILSALGYGFRLQLFGFIVGTLIAFFGMRPVFMRCCDRGSKGVRTNMDALFGERGLVTQRIDNGSNAGRALIRGDDWRAVSVDGSILELGQQVEVVRVEGVKLYVKEAE